MFSRSALAVIALDLLIAAFSLSGASSTTPTLTSVANNHSYTPAGFPNSGIAPGTTFAIFGSNMSSAPATVTLQSSAGLGIRKTLEGATLSISVGGTTVTPAMYYATPAQIAAFSHPTRRWGRDDAGTISLEGQNGNYAVTEFSTGNYQTAPLLPANAITSSGGAFTFSGEPGSYVAINGTSGSLTGANSSFTCLADQSTLQFMVPPYILRALPAGPGTLEVQNLAGFGSYTEIGLDFGDYYGFTAVQINTTYK